MSSPAPAGWPDDPDEVQLAPPKPENAASPAQWRVVGENEYQPCGKTVDTIPSGNYWPIPVEGGLILQRRAVIGDNIIEMPDCASAQVLARMKKFWASRERYQKYGLVYKRGILLYGPPGSGKTITVRQVCQQVLDQDGIVLHDPHPGVCSSALAALRRIEKLRPVVVVHEDVDDLIQRCGEGHLLALLDGEEQIDNVVHIATTNYPERLGARIVNRPSRFDDRIEVPMPSSAQREHYLRHALRHESVEEGTVKKWAVESTGLSIAHLRELVTAVHCLEAPYEETLKRLQDMAIRPESGEDEGFQPKRSLGFGRQGPR